MSKTKDDNTKEMVPHESFTQYFRQMAYLHLFLHLHKLWESTPEQPSPSEKKRARFERRESERARERVCSGRSRRRRPRKAAAGRRPLTGGRTDGRTDERSNETAAKKGERKTVGGRLTETNAALRFTAATTTLNEEKRVVKADAAAAAAARAQVISVITTTMFCLLHPSHFELFKNANEFEGGFSKRLHVALFGSRPPLRCGEHFSNHLEMY